MARVAKVATTVASVLNDAENRTSPQTTKAADFTAGVNAYFQGQNVKATLDVTHLSNGSPVTSDDNGVIQSADDQFVIRAQFQSLI